MSHFKKVITKEELNEFPLSKYNGSIQLIEKSSELKEAVNEILKEPIIGIDTETKPTFKKGQLNDVSLIQIATSNKVYLIRIHKTGFEKSLIQLFESNQVLKIGIAFKDDVKDLKRMVFFNDRNIIDLNELAAQLGFESIGAKKLTALVLGFRISKRQQTSNWEADQLTQQQIDYAATDAWICREIYLKLKEKYPNYKGIR